MRLSVLMYVVPASGRHGRRSAISREKECSARSRVSPISTGLLVRFVALLVRFTGKVAQSTGFRQDARGAGGSSANASGRLAMEEGARTSGRVPGSRRSVRPIGHSNDESRQRFGCALKLRIQQNRGARQFRAPISTVRSRRYPCSLSAQDGGAERRFRARARFTYNVHVLRALAQPDQCYASRWLTIHDEEIHRLYHTCWHARRPEQILALVRELPTVVPGFSWWRSYARVGGAGGQSFEPPTTNCPMCSRTLWRKRSLLVTVVPPLSTNT